MTRNTDSRISGIFTFVLYDPKHSFQNYCNPHNNPVGCQTPSPECQGRTQHFGWIETTGPEFLDSHKNSV
jgi:hypothetical protein